MTKKYMTCSLMLLIFFSLFCFYPAESTAVTSDCLKRLHKQAINDAVDLMPAELRNILEPLEKNMHQRVDSIHATSPRERQSYEFYYKNIVAAIQEQNKGRHEYLSRILTEITIYPFLKYCPIKTYESCDDSRILKEAVLIYDGYEPKVNYSTLSADNFIGQPHQYAVARDSDKLRQFYNFLVNEISDLWVSALKDAGGNISGIPQKNTLVRGTLPATPAPGKEVPQTVNVKDSGAAQKGAQTFTDTDLGKFRSGADFTTYESESSPYEKYYEKQMQKWESDQRDREQSNEQKRSKIREFDDKISEVDRKIEKLREERAYWGSKNYQSMVDKIESDISNLYNERSRLISERNNVYYQ